MEFTPTEQFVYASSFLPPLLYLFYERYEEFKIYIMQGRRQPEAVSLEPRGFGLIMVVALILFVYTAFAFGATRMTEVTGAKASLAFRNVGPFVVYLYSLFCWYLMILTEVNPEAADFVDEMRRQSDEVAGEFAERLRSQQGAS